MVTYFLHDGLLDINLERHQSIDVIEHFKWCIRSFAGKDKADAHDFLCINRMSRMCYELYHHNKLTNMDSDDALLLYSCPQDEKYEWVFIVLNKTLENIMSTAHSIVVADQIAKNIEIIQNS